jgi:predicted LPLAT superfamily acyltransferase
MVRIMGTVTALALIAVVAFPFARNAYHRFEVAQRLRPLMDDRDQAAWRNWSGDAVSFGRSLFDRCTLINGQGAQHCEAYKVAIQ